MMDANESADLMWKTLVTYFPLEQMVQAMHRALIKDDYTSAAYIASAIAEKKKRTCPQCGHIINRGA